VRYELATFLKESFQFEKFFTQILEIECYLGKVFKNNIITEKNCELVFYRLAVLFEKYDRLKDDKYRLEAIALINKFYSDPFVYDIVGYLRHFTGIFQCQNCIFTPETEDYAVSPFRKTQILEGLNKLIETNFSIKYGIILKDHQKDSYEALAQHIQYFDDLKGGYLHLPTGSGKTYIMLLQILATRIPTLILVPRTALMDQTIENIKKISPDTRVTRYDGHAKEVFSGQIMVTTYQMLEKDFRTHRRIPLELFGQVWADEAHNALTAKQAEIIRALQTRSLVLGLTATDYFNGKRPKNAFSHVEDVFGTKIHEVDLVTLIENGSLSPVKNVIVTDRKSVV